MKQYYIKLKQGASAPLSSLLVQHLKLPVEEAAALVNVGAVWNNDTKQRIKDSRFPVTGETILVNRPDFPIREYHFVAEELIYEDEDLFVVYKKPFFPTVPTPYADVNSLVYGFNRYLEAAGKQGPAVVINRLDLSARGLVILARGKKPEAGLHALFKNRQIKKWYLVKTEKFSGVQKRYLISDTLEWQGKARPAKSRLSLLKTDDRFCYFLARPLTGRTHQLRKHFARYVHPVYGDPVYGWYDKESLMGLVCYCYIFSHPVTGKKLIIKHLPPDFCAS